MAQVLWVRVPPWVLIFMNTKLLTILGFLLVFGLAVVYIVWIIGPKIFSDVKLGSVLPTAPVASSKPSAALLPSGLKSFSSKMGFSLQYPAKWGLLTCSNSSSFELDPENSADMLDVICDFAQKPITIIRADSSCLSEQVDAQNYKQKSWCVRGGSSIQITHRVSANQNVASSQNDYSNEIEEIIKTIKFN